MDYKRKALKVKQSPGLVRFFRLIFVLILGISLNHPPALAGPDENTVKSPQGAEKGMGWSPDANWVDIGFGYFFSRSSSSWEISFPGLEGRGRSVLEFNGMDSPVPYLFGEIKHPRYRLSFSFLYGAGDNAGGQGTDADYTGGDLDLRSRFDIAGETTLWIADVQRAFSFFNNRLIVKPFLGWKHYEERLRLTNGYWTMIRGVESGKPIFGLNSTYDFSWDSLRVGLKSQWDFIKRPQSGLDQVSLKGTLALFPYTRYRGQGTWNLREDFRKDPSFSHEADSIGLTGLDGVLAIAYRPWKYFEVEAGGWISFFKVWDGSDTTYFSDQTTAVATLEEAKALRLGFFVQMIGRF